jgi:hypothetical protein
MVAVSIIQQDQSAVAAATLFRAAAITAVDKSETTSAV